MQHETPPVLYILTVSWHDPMGTEALISAETIDPSVPAPQHFLAISAQVNQVVLGSYCHTHGSVFSLRILTPDIQ